MKIALVGPLERSNTGVGEYNSLLVPLLEKKCDLQFFEDSTSMEEGEAATKCAFSLVDAIKSQNFDHVVFILGNSIYHYQTYILAKYLQGHCWFHDSTLAGMHLAYAAGFGEVNDRVKYMRDAIYGNYGPYRRFRLSISDLLSFDALSRQNIFLTTELTRNARSVIVSTQSGEDMIRSDFLFTRRDSILSLPLGIEDHGIRGTDSRWDRKDLVSVGRLDSSKRPQEVIDLFLSLSAELGNLSFVGKMDDKGLIETLQKGIPDQFRDRIHFKSGLARPEYLHVISQAFCAIQLRTRSHGEMSAAITDALSVGTPCITNLSAAAGYQGVFVNGTMDELHSSLRRLLENQEHWKSTARESIASAETFSLENTVSQLLLWLSSH